MRAGELPAPTAPALPLHEARERFERDYILRALAAQQGNISRTAEVLGVERSNLYRKMRAFGIAPVAAAAKAEEEAAAVSAIGFVTVIDPQLVLENLSALKPFDLQVVLGGARSAPPTGTSPTISLSSTATP